MYHIMALISIKAGKHDTYMNEFAPRIAEEVKDAGGSFTIRTNDVRGLSGPIDFDRLVVMSWPSRSVAESWWQTHGHAITGRAEDLATFNFIGVEGVDHAQHDHTEGVGETTVADHIVEEAARDQAPVQQQGDGQAQAQPQAQ